MLKSLKLFCSLKRGKPMKLILTTGISGVGEKKYLKEWEDYCARRGKRVRVFYVGEAMLKHADKDLLQMNRSAVFAGILSDISANSENYDAIVICMHAFMFWKERFYRTYDRFIKKFSPDMYITFIDDFRNIAHRLSQRGEWKGKLTYTKILYWQNVEVEVNSGWADFADKPFFALASGQPIS